MNDPATVLVLLAAIVAIAIVAKRIALPYPIAFVIGGVLLAFLPNAPHVALDPQLVFVVLLPPLLFAGGWGTDLLAFRDNARAISLLAVGLVLATTGLVAVVAHALAPEYGWAMAFVLGAIVAPPDAVAAGAVFERYSVPQRIVTILEGEGLVNDATALVVYGFAVAAAVNGTFSLPAATLAFAGESLGAVAIGLALAYGAVRLSIALRAHDLSDALIDNLVALGLPYLVYLTAGAAHTSSVLATVAAGIYTSRHSSEMYEAEGRVVAGAVWQLMIFLLNAFAFVLIGLQLRSLVTNASTLTREVVAGAVISATLILLRIVWVFVAVYAARLIPAIARREAAPKPASVFVVAWSGMRGVVSLAAALALPLAIRSGLPLPGRAAVIFIAFCVVFVTLVGQGLSLAPILRLLEIDGDNFEAREVEVRVAALEAGIARLHELESSLQTPQDWELADQVMAEYEFRIGYLRERLAGTQTMSATTSDDRLEREALHAEHEAVLRMRDAGEIPDAIFRRIRYDLDLADTRLGVRTSG